MPHGRRHRGGLPADRSTSWRRAAIAGIEWRCGPDNPGLGAGGLERYGFTYEGTMRQTYWLKGHNWDTRIYSILDSEWPADRRPVRGLAGAGELRRRRPADQGVE
jgi:hypothetical protein